MEKWETIQSGPFQPTGPVLRTCRCPDRFRDGLSIAALPEQRPVRCAHCFRIVTR